jgi:hypothetical protein
MFTKIILLTFFVVQLNGQKNFNKRMGLRITPNPAPQEGGYQVKIIALQEPLVAQVFEISTFILTALY